MASANLQGLNERVHLVRILLHPVCRNRTLHNSKSISDQVVTPITISRVSSVNLHGLWNDRDVARWSLGSLGFCDGRHFVTTDSDCVIDLVRKPSLVIRFVAVERNR